MPCTLVRQEKETKARYGEMNDSRKGSVRAEQTEKQQDREIERDGEREVF